MSPRATRAAAQRLVLSCALVIATGAGALSPLGASAATFGGSGATVVSTQDVAPSASGTISGEVVGPDHQPLEGAEVYVRDGNATPTSSVGEGAWRLVATSGADGTWRSTELPHATYIVMARGVDDPHPSAAAAWWLAPGSAFQSVTVAEGDHVLPYLRVADWPRIAGRVVAPEKYAAQTTAVVRRGNYGTGPIGQFDFPTASDGTWVQERVPEGKASLTVVPSITVDGQVFTTSASVPFTAVAGEVTQTEDLVLSVLEGRHTPAGTAPLTLLLSRLDPATGQWGYPESHEMTPGRFAIPVTAPGRYQVTFPGGQGDEGWFNQVAPRDVVVDVAAGSVVAVPDQSPGSVSGVVALPAGTPKGKQAVVSLWNPSAKTWSHIGAVPVDAGGRFTVAGLAAGRYRVTLELHKTYRSDVFPRPVGGSLVREVTVAAGHSTPVRFDDALRRITLPGKGLRLRPTKIVTGSSPSASYTFPQGSGVAGIAIRFEWWTKPVTKQAKAKVRKAGKSLSATRVAGATDSSWKVRSKYRGHQVRVRIVADSALHRRTVFSSKWSSTVR